MILTTEYKVYGYRWIVLLVYFIITFIISMQWLTFAPIAREARVVYNATAFQIDLLSMIYIVGFLLMCAPASFIIDKHGLKIGVGIGALFSGVFGLMKGIFPESYMVMAISQTGLAIAQFVGMIAVNIATPMLIHRTGETYQTECSFQWRREGDCQR
jgi:hypothetical protein